MVSRGEIYLVNFYPSLGSEIRKIRPATEVFIRASQSGLDRDSVVQINQIRSIDKQRLARRIGRLDDAIMSQVNKAILISLGFVNI